MGQVYLARDTQLERNVAVKVLPADLVESTDRVHRFVREARAASALNHPSSTPRDQRPSGSSLMLLIVFPHGSSPTDNACRCVARGVRIV